jgi:hypothetical protein
LTLHLAGGAERPDREAVEAWQAFDDGRQFVTLSSEASIAAGTDAAEAQAAAARTTEATSAPSSVDPT